MRHHRSGRSRRASSVRALSAIGAAALALAALTTACSGSGPRPAAGGAQSADTPYPGPDLSAFGTLDTDSADPPVINPALNPSAPTPAGFRNALPTSLTPPAGWVATAWLDSVHAAAGPKAVSSHNQDPNFTNTAWQWSTADVTSLEAGTAGDGQDHLTSVSCSAEGFNPANAKAAAEIAGALELCAQTGLSGGSAQAAQTWIGDQVGSVLSELRTAAPGRESVTAAPTFGAATYQIVGQHQSPEEYSVLLSVR
jgi:hypothetical protein